jgi:TRAP-type mannitol/chloroaromatic compound transport system permease small subunit
MTDVTKVIESLEHHDALVETYLTRMIDRSIMAICGVVNWIWVVLLLVIIGNVVLRYAFSQGMIELEELQWHLYAIGWLVGLSSTFIVDGHVRVDVVHERLAYRTKLWLELFGLLFLFMPFVIFIIYYSVPFVDLSWTTNERSTSANGLPARWLVKGFLLFSFILLCLAGISRGIRVIASLLHSPPNGENHAHEATESRA